jgi:Zn-dependent M28 family amino/carboxypeptidase
MGDQVYFQGANDNASGTAMVMDLARHFASAGGPPEYSMVFVALSGEEAGLMGAGYLAENPLFDLSRIRFLINLDMVGTGGDGITVVNGKVFQEEFDLLHQINEEMDLLHEVAIRGESCNSDHCPFYQKGVPAVFIYTRDKEYNEYHNLDDRAIDLPLTEYEDLFRLLVAFTQNL